MAKTKEEMLALIVGKDAPAEAVAFATARWRDYDTDPDQGRAVSTYVQGYAAALAATPAAPDAGLLGELARLDAAATAGPWERGSAANGDAPDMFLRIYCDDSLGSMVADCRGLHSIALKQADKEANADLICALRNALPTLLARHGAPAATWVAVGERLPEPAKSDADYSARVLALGEPQMDGPAFVGYCDLKTGTWFLAHDNQPVMPNVTHWQPIPTQP